MVLLLLVFLGQRSRNRSANKAQQVVLACIIFNENGKVMVDADGLVPSHKITESFSGRVSVDNLICQRKLKPRISRPLRMFLTQTIQSSPGYFALLGHGQPF